MGINMKFLYSKFTKAFSEVVLILLIASLVTGLLVVAEMYTSEVIDSDYEFQDTRMAYNLVYEAVDDLASEMYLQAENVYNEYKEKAKTGETNEDEIENLEDTWIIITYYEEGMDYEEVYYEDEYYEEEYYENGYYEDGYYEGMDNASVDDEEAMDRKYEEANGYSEERETTISETNYSEEQETAIPESEAEYRTTYQAKNINMLYALKDETVQSRILAYTEKYFVNYHFVVRTEDEVLLTDIKNMDDVVFITEMMHTYGSSSNAIYIESYINKELVKGDEFFQYKSRYDKIAKYFWTIVTVMVIGAIIALILFVYVLVTAGYKEDGTLGVGWMDNIPIELFWIPMLPLLFLTCEVMDIYTSIYLQCGIWMVLMSMWGFYGITTLKTILSRLKNHIFMRKSLIGIVLLMGAKMLKAIVLDMNTKLKATIVIASILLFEVLIWGIGICYDYETTLFVWGIIKVAQFVLFMYLYSMLLKVRNGAKKMAEGETEVKIDTEGMYGIIGETAAYMNDISVGMDKAVAEKLKSEQLKTELITNVSHDIKTPLTSIINYIDLMKKEDISNPKVIEYLKVADKQSLRLKKLTEDIIEASKAATGNIQAELTRINVSEMIAQALGEYENKFSEAQLITVYENAEASYYALADGRLLWRVIDNLFSNIYKYAMEGTRIYIDVREKTDAVEVVVKNISKYQLNISSDELKQRFVRGDASRSTSGNGLGLSIAESLAQLQGGKLQIDINGDLFTTILSLQKGLEEAQEVQKEEIKEKKKEKEI